MPQRTGERTRRERLEYLEALIADWPPLTREQQDCLAILLRPAS